ncbi:MAG: DUF1990 domain-containing protein [Acidimicrobiia bacterium]|nr:DUF1990 domain-containing protein [Acidimicrobiia bacterium]
MHVFSIAKPSHNADTSGPYTYPGLGSTAHGRVPDGYRVDAAVVSLGTGRTGFDRARAAILAWRPFDLDWVEVTPEHAAIRTGTVVTVTARVAGMWFQSRCRIVDVVDTRDRFGFSYATLPGHVVSGEESFEVIYEPSTGEVRFRIEAHSRPAHPLVWLTYPFARTVQCRFRRESCAAMKCALTPPV